MKRNVLIAAFVLAAGSIMAADPKDELSAAAKKLADGGNYSWKQTVDNGGAGGGGGGGGGGRGFGGGPVDGHTAGGVIHTVSDFGGNSFERLQKGTNSATKGMDGTWRTASEAAAAAAAADPNAGGGRRGRGGFGGGTIVAPAATITDVVGKLQSVSMTGGAYAGDLTEAGAKENLMPNFGGRRGGGGGGGGGNGPDISGAKGSAKFWVANGVVSKYELKVQGKMSFGGNDIDINRTTTVEIKDVGTTKITAPDDILKKL